MLDRAINGARRVLKIKGAKDSTLNIVTVSLTVSLIGQVLELALSRTGTWAFNVAFTLPVYTVTYAVAATCLKTELNLQSKAIGAVGATLASLDVMMNIVGVAVPLWRVAIFKGLGGEDGEIGVKAFGWVQAVHWAASIGCIRVLDRIGKKGEKAE